MKGLNELFVVAWMLFGILLSPLFFIGFDFWAGVRKAKQRGEKITSEGWKRTVDKVARYYNMLLALVVIDCMQIAGVWYLDNYYDYHIPIFPFVTIMGALVVAAIEVKSIFEKAEDKVKKQVSDVSSLALEIAKSKADPEEIAKAVVDFINRGNVKEKKK
ncbi:hypothetical protein [Bacteroides reticulotermitis]|uniref:hypothetical protein n=1 Tax=Bacteroides reticulotermitis TaxID=1133319 RepID=UPI003A83E9FE